MSINLNPGFPGGIKKTLTNRAGKIRDRERNFNYRRYAYINFESPAKTAAEFEDSTSLFDLYSKGSYKIGQVPSGGHLDLYENEGGVRRLKPQITSVSINQDGGGDIYNSYLREVEIQFKVYSLSQLTIVEKNFFRLGSEVKINYGWLGSTEEGEEGSLSMSVYNFGFSMQADGSYNCNIKGLAGDSFPGATRMGGTLKLKNDDEINALGDEGVNPVDISGAFMAKYKAAFGIDPDEDASASSIDNGEIKHERDKENKYDLFMAGIMNAGESESVVPFMGDDPIRTPFTTLKSFVDMANRLSGGSDKETFKFNTDEELVKISPNTKEFGSSDPRKYIFPGSMADYGDENEYESGLSDFSEAKIQNILISINEITQIVKNKGTTVNDQFQPPRLIDVFGDLAGRIANVSGGLVQLDIKPPDVDAKNSKEYTIQNKTQMLKKTKQSGEPFEFKSIGEESMVKSISIDTEFDSDIMLFLTVGNVRNGNINLEPLRAIYPEIPEKSEFPKDLEEEETKQESEGEIPTKSSIGKDGIDDGKANSIATQMRKLLVSDTNDGTQVILPFQLKLSIELDGIDGIPFMAPITADRLPETFSSAKVRFLVTGVEHSFDGNGGWSTNLKTVMAMGAV